MKQHYRKIVLSHRRVLLATSILSTLLSSKGSFEVTSEPVPVMLALRMIHASVTTRYLGTSAFLILALGALEYRVNRENHLICGSTLPAMDVA